MRIRFISQNIRRISNPPYHFFSFRWKRAWKRWYRGDSSSDTTMTRQFSIPHTTKLGERPCQMPVQNQVAMEAAYTGRRRPKLPSFALAFLLSRSMGLDTEMG